jgi:dipeptide/tripeptide permease
MYICQPIGSMLSGIVLERLGRKKSMILVNFPHILGWFIFYFANSVPMLYFSSVIMGLGVGFMEAPIITYVGEISQPEMRGILTSYSGKQQKSLFSVLHFGLLRPEVNQLGHEDDHSLLCGDEVDVGAIPLLPLYAFIACTHRLASALFYAWAGITQ